MLLPGQNAAPLMNTLKPGVDIIQCTSSTSRHKRNIPRQNTDISLEPQSVMVNDIDNNSTQRVHHVVLNKYLRLLVTTLDCKLTTVWFGNTPYMHTLNTIL